MRPCQDYYFHVTAIIQPYEMRGAASTGPHGPCVIEGSRRHL